ncbi:MAG: hypothetical protein NC213_08050, partial [Acetobacter sp.]|nr:hypothetical protein [Bacteroides sp.]MCM1341681.1 hypothetical protein [Acetobacter sp.]MCM1434270.1 hypothetical protein [Clostridiales bacterium]
MKINIGKQDVCYNCIQGKAIECSADIDDVYIDEDGSICVCKAFQKKEEKTKAKRFVKPTIEEIKAYAVEKGHNCNAEEFYNYYESVDWCIGNKKMKQWKNAVANWSIKQNRWEKHGKSNNCDKLESSPSYDLEKVMRNALDNTEIR